MKKIFFILLTAVALLTVSCKDSSTTNNTPEDPENPDTIFTEISYLCGEYVGPLTEQSDAPEYYQFLFGKDGVTMNADGTFNGSGKVYLFSIFAPSKGEDFFPASGIYLGNDSLTAYTFYCTSDPDANGVSSIYTINDGSIDFDNAIRFETGLITILGDATKGNFTFVLTDENQETYFLQCEGASPIELVR